MPVFQVTVSQRDAQDDSQETTQRLYFLRGHALNVEHVARISQTLLADPVTELWAIGQPGVPEAGHTIEITFLPGVTDSVAENLVRAAEELGLPALEEAASGMRVIVRGDADPARLHDLARARFANEVIQRYVIDQPIPPPFTSLVSGDSDRVETIALSGADDDALLAISRERRLALDLNEMRAIRDDYRGEAREPTDVELETLAQTWSEHCVHKTFKALIDVDGATINGLLKTYIRAATEKLNKPWVKSAFVDNAGIIAFNARWDLAFKVETHNHPSALEPFGGANTGLGGVIRDVLGVSALPIANTDVLCFGPLERTDVPAGVLPPRRVHDGVVKGIEDYGNKMGIPTVNGAVLFHEGYTANPLVFAGCVGLRPAAPAARPASAEAGDLIIVIGGRTGRDGLRGATFSSMEMGAETGGIASASVQIGHPIHEKQTQEAILRARDAGLYRAITDCGAGGFSSAVGEMASGLGATVQLDNALLKYPGLQPWEIWLSEAQERMVLAVPAENWPALKAICDGQDIPAFALGVFEDSGRLTIKYAGRIVGDLSIQFLHEGIPQRRLSADPVPRSVSGTPRASRRHASRRHASARHAASDATADLLALLAHPNIRSKEAIVRVFDHEVKGATAVKPFVGAANHGPGDAAVLAPDPSSTLGLSLSNGICPQYGERDPYAMAWAAVDEALRNAVAVGADPDRIAILDNFCWGNPNLPDRLGSLVACAQGCHDAALAYGAPFISGKDSLNNEYTGADGAKHAIPGTLLISALGIVPDVHATVTMDLKQAGNALYLVGDTRDELGMSHYAGLRQGAHADAIVPQPVPDALARLRALHGAIRAGHVRACHDCSEGGFAVALAEMCLAGRLGASVNLSALQADAGDDIVLLFSESACRLIVEVAPTHTAAFERALAGTPCARIGDVASASTLTVTGLGGAKVIDADIARLELAWRGAIAPDPPVAARPAPARAPLSLPSVTPGKRVLILHANGSNRDHDAALAVELAGGLPEIVHVNQVRARSRMLADYHMLILPGGFSYGDDLGAGVLWALDLRERLGESLQAFVAAGRPVLGICNGFQALIKAGLFEAGVFAGGERAITLTYNERRRFECRWVMLEPEPGSVSVFTRGLGEPIYCPIAHGEGRLVTRDDETLHGLSARGMIALRYLGEDYPHNPNGSAGRIAGLSNAQGNVLGLMPHPENNIFPWQHPRWHRGERGMGGLGLFSNGLRNA
ncbi:MAG TPA: phosphoribosylformylglycinamidine synthase subunit PurL [Thermoflexales bacterium]|nr:phosphoribosylformylglycinamidine synthase subunit PurL [Thermoflexales bacterium]